MERLTPVVLVVSSLCFLAMAAPVWAQSSAGEDPRWTVLDTPPAPGEVCIVCGVPAPSDAMHLRYKGRSVAVDQKHFPEWQANPERHFRQKQARAALFDEEAMPDQTGGQGWLWLGIYALVGTLVGGVTAYLAVARGLAPVPWFFAGVFFNVVALILVLTRKGSAEQFVEGIPGGLRKVPITRAPMICPVCQTQNHPSASQCIQCDSALTPTAPSEASDLRNSGGAHA